MASFEDQMNGWINRTIAQNRSTVQKVCVQLASSIVMRTPVDTGRARGNWNPSLDSPDNSQTNNTDQSGASSINAAKTIAQGAPGKVFYLVNNLPYIKKLEDGSSAQAPQGMVDITVRTFQSIVRRLL